jgi:hypothetical protein
VSVTLGLGLELWLAVSEGKSDSVAVALRVPLGLGVTLRLGEKLAVTVDVDVTVRMFWGRLPQIWPVPRSSSAVPIATVVQFVRVELDPALIAACIWASLMPAVTAPQLRLPMLIMGLRAKAVTFSARSAGTTMPLVGLTDIKPKAVGLLVAPWKAVSAQPLLAAMFWPAPLLRPGLKLAEDVVVRYTDVTTVPAP